MSRAQLTGTGSSSRSRSHRAVAGAIAIVKPGCGTRVIVRNRHCGLRRVSLLFTYQLIQHNLWVHTPAHRSWRRR